METLSHWLIVRMKLKPFIWWLSSASCLLLMLYLTGCSSVGHLVFVNRSGLAIEMLPEGADPVLLKLEQRFVASEFSQGIRMIVDGQRIAFKSPIIDDDLGVREGPGTTFYLIINSDLKLLVAEKVDGKYRAVDIQPEGFPLAGEKQVVSSPPTPAISTAKFP